MRTVRLTALFTKPRDFLPLAGTFFRDVSLILSLITGRNEVAAKVMFLQVCVCPQGGGCLPQCMLGCHAPPPDQADTTPPAQADPPPPGKQTVYERPVRILLECILVRDFFSVLLEGPSRR